MFPSSVRRWNSKVTVLNRMCNSIADCHEYTAVVALVKFRTIFLPELSEDPLGAGDVAIVSWRRWTVAATRRPAVS